MPKVNIICGSPGAGKTTYAKRLAAEQKAILLDIDTVTESMAIAGMAAANQDPTDRDSRFFKQHFREPIYSTLFAIAKENVLWINVVIVGPFTREIRNENWPHDLETTFKTQVAIHYVYCLPEIRRKRLLYRNNPRDQAKLSDWNNHRKYYGDESPPSFPHIFIDTS